MECYIYVTYYAYLCSRIECKLIGIWTLHNNTPDTNTNYGDYAITIDELEQRTGIDFFCNLPDAIENKVEAQLDLSYWDMSKSN